MNTYMRWLGWLGLFAGGLGLSSSGCNDDPYCFVCEDSFPGEAGQTSTRASNNGTNSGTSGITPSTSSGAGGAGGEMGLGGEGGDTTTCEPKPDLDSDPRNCGACGVQCRANGAVPICVDGRCDWAQCSPGREDFNQIHEDGCESICSQTNDGDEICDGVDNDCNGVVDDGFDLTTVDNCGECGNVCNLSNAEAACEQVNGRYTCRIAQCDDTFFDFDKVHGNGCEKKCIESNGGVEICDGKDNNCDGRVDEEAPNAGTDCDEGLCPWHPQGLCLGPCANRGTYVCSGNQLVCVPKQNAPTQQVELCDGIDNNCDGVPDEDFDLNIDVNNCGECGNECDVPNAIAACVAGQCVVDTCVTGFNDLDPNQPGCEYECPETVNDEVCDGIDNDCDGEIDEVDDLVPPTEPCLQDGPCSGSTWECGTIPDRTGDEPTIGWFCNYKDQDDRIEVKSTTVWPGPEQACDDFDNNCDNNIDEGIGRFSFCTDDAQCTGTCDQGRCTCSTDNDCDFGYGCSNGYCTSQCFDGVGECQDIAAVQCAVGGDGIICPASANTGNATDELCDGLDNNCDGQVDETMPNPGNLFSGVVDEVVFIESGVDDFYIYKYEASRPDSVSDDAGIAETRSCSKAGVMPWTSVNQAEAAAACSAAGMQLCSESQWQRACDSAASGTFWSYPSNASTYVAGNCNDAQHPDNSTTQTAWATGSGAQCYTDSAAGDIYDLSGNVSEWTRSPVTVGSKTYYRVRGGNYTSYGPATACNFSFVLDVPTFANADLGFRCCGPNPPNVP